MACMDGCEKSPPPGLDPRTVQPVANCYTDWAIPAHTFYQNVDILSILERFDENDVHEVAPDSGAGQPGRCPERQPVRGAKTLLQYSEIWC
jgi:hypothetical protein